MVDIVRDIADIAADKVQEFGIDPDVVADDPADHILLGGRRGGIL
jgi:hypothetical protein